MRKVILESVGSIKYLEVPKPEVRPGWVRVKLLRCGLCGTDVHNYYKETIFGKDRYPFNMGHETCGIVDEMGEGVQGLQVGDMVVINPYWTCNTCEACHMDHSNNCDNFTTIGLTGPSGNSEYTLAPATAILKTRQDMDPNLLVFTEPVGTVVYAMDKIKLDPTKDVLILGAGGIGMLFFQLLKNAAINSLTVASRSEKKLEFARSLGAKYAINTTTTPFERKYDVIIDCTGSAKCAEDDISLCKFGAQVLIFGVCPIDSTITISPFELYRKDLSIYASFALNNSAFQRALHLIQSGVVDVKPLLAGVYPVGKLEECIHMVHEGKVLGRIIIDTTRFE